MFQHHRRRSVQSERMHRTGGGGGRTHVNNAVVVRPLASYAGTERYAGFSSAQFTTLLKDEPQAGHHTFVRRGMLWSSAAAANRIVV